MGNRFNKVYSATYQVPPPSDAIKSAVVTAKDLKSLALPNQNETATKATLFGFYRTFEFERLGPVLPCSGSEAKHSGHLAVLSSRNI